MHVSVVGCCGFSFLAPKTKISTSCAEKWIRFAMFLSIFRCSGRILIGPRRRMCQPICRQAIYQVSSLSPHRSLRSRRRFITSWSAEFVDEKWPKLVAKKVCACFFARLVARRVCASGIIFPSVSELVFIFRLPRRSLQWFEQERSEKSILRGDANRNFRSESFVRVFFPRKHKFFRMEKFGEPNFPCGETEEDNFPATLL